MLYDIFLQEAEMKIANIPLSKGPTYVNETLYGKKLLRGVL